MSKTGEIGICERHKKVTSGKGYAPAWDSPVVMTTTMMMMMIRKYFFIQSDRTLECFGSTQGGCT